MSGSYQFKFHVLCGKKDIFEFSYFPRTVADWNCLLALMPLYHQVHQSLLKLIYQLFLVIVIYLSLFNFVSLFYIIFGWCNVLAIFTDLIYVDVDEVSRDHAHYSWGNLCPQPLVTALGSMLS